MLYVNTGQIYKLLLVLPGPCETAAIAGNRILYTFQTKRYANIESYRAQCSENGGKLASIRNVEDYAIMQRLGSSFGM